MSHGLVAVGAGAAFGAWLRWGLGALLNPIFPNIPLGTLSANLLGGYLMGLTMSLLGHVQSLPPEVRLFAATGFLGRIDHLLYILGGGRDTHRPTAARLVGGHGRSTCGGVIPHDCAWNHQHELLACDERAMTSTLTRFNGGETPDRNAIRAPHIRQPPVIEQRASTNLSPHWLLSE
jgi:PII-like signaling protein